MIKVKTEKGNITMNISGSLEELCADTLMIIRSVAESIEKQDETAAKKFKKVIERSFEDGIMFADSDKIDELKKKLEEDCLDRLKQELKELKKALESIIDKDEGEEDE